MAYGQLKARCGRVTRSGGYGANGPSCLARRSHRRSSSSADPRARPGFTACSPRPAPCIHGDCATASSRLRVAPTPARCAARRDWPCAADQIHGSTRCTPRRDAPDEELAAGVRARPCIYEANTRPAFVAFSEARDAAASIANSSHLPHRCCGQRQRLRGRACLKCQQSPKTWVTFWLSSRCTSRCRAADLSDVLASTVSVVDSQMRYQSDRVALAWRVREGRRS